MKILAQSVVGEYLEHLGEAVAEFDYVLYYTPCPAGFQCAEGRRKINSANIPQKPSKQITLSY